MIDCQTKGRSKSVMKEALGSGSQTLKLKVLEPGWFLFCLYLTPTVVQCSVVDCSPNIYHHYTQHASHVVSIEN